MRVRLSPRSRSDLLGILNYLKERSPDGAGNVARALRRTLKLIGEHPQVGRLAGEQDARVLPVGHYPYLIYWSVEAGEVSILHIRHAVRRPWVGVR